jgi:hypothetical protein
MKILILLLSVLVSVSSNAHEMTPTYPELRPSHVPDVYTTTLEMFNRRSDVEYYDIGVFDNDWNPIPFVSAYKVIRLQYLGHVKFDIYIRKRDVDNVEFICSRSKIRKEDVTRTAISSKICSRVK